MTHLPGCLYHDPLMTAASITTKHGAWQGLQYDITGIKRCWVPSSERTHPDVMSVVG